MSVYGVYAEFAGSGSTTQTLFVGESSYLTATLLFRTVDSANPNRQWSNVNAGLPSRSNGSTMFPEEKLRDTMSCLDAVSNPLRKAVTGMNVLRTPQVIEVTDSELAKLADGTTPRTLKDRIESVRAKVLVGGGIKDDFNVTFMFSALKNRLTVAKTNESLGEELLSSLYYDMAQERSHLAILLASVMVQNKVPEAKQLLHDRLAEAGTPASRPSQPAEEPKPLNEYVRPNGDIYYARKWGAYEDVEVLRKARTEKQWVFFTGEPGTGKTALAEAAFGEDLVTMVFSGDTEVSHVVGSFIPNPDPVDAVTRPYIWVNGPLLIAVRDGRPFLADEIGLADPKVLSPLYPLMDGRGFLEVSDNPSIGTVMAAEGFYILGATNPKAPGVKMSEALTSRFSVQAEVTTDYELAKKLKVDPNIVGFAQSLSNQMKTNRVSWAPQMRELLAYRDIEALWGSSFALNNLLAKCPEKDREKLGVMLRQSALSETARAARI